MSPAVPSGTSTPVLPPPLLPVPVPPLLSGTVHEKSAETDKASASVKIIIFDFSNNFAIIPPIKLGFVKIDSLPQWSVA